MLVSNSKHQQQLVGAVNHKVDNDHEKKGKRKKVTKGSRKKKTKFGKLKEAVFFFHFSPLSPFAQKKEAQRPIVIPIRLPNSCSQQ